LGKDILPYQPNEPITEVLAKLPQAELERSLSGFLAPLTQLLPDQRLKRVAAVAVQGILAGQSPVVAAMAQSVSRQDANPWAAAKRVYRLLDNDRFTHALLQQGLYQVTQSTVQMQMQRENLPYLIVAVDPVNFEKPYTEKLEGVSIIHKSTPPDLRGGARLARGYPAITATVVNTQVPATTYAQWFSYTTDDFLSQNREVERAIVSTRTLFPAGQYQVRFVGDAGLDDQKVFTQVERVGVEAQFIIRACHLNRIVQVYNPRWERWETESLQGLVNTIPHEGSFEASFNHAGYSWSSTVSLGWLLLRLPDDEGHETEQQQQLWVLVAEDTDEKGKERTLVLLTNVPIHTMEDAQQLYCDWRLRGRIEAGYRFDQEQGLDVEDMRVRTLERMRRLFVLVLVAAQFIFYLMDSWPAAAVLWLRRLGGKLGRKSDRDGPYIVLRGLSAVWQAVAALSWLLVSPFPHEEFQRCG
jgi:hypothetical protein